MSERPFRLKPCCRRRLAILLMVLGSLLAVLGIILFVLGLGDKSSYESEEMSDEVEQTVEIAEQVEEENLEESVIEDSTTMENTSDEVSSDEKSDDMEEVSEDVEVVDESTPAEPLLDYFEGSYMSAEGVTYMIADGTVVQEGEVPAFHNVSLIITEPGINAKTDEVSDNFRAVMTAIPDREFSLSVLVSAEAIEITGTTPDRIQGTQWIFSYSDEAFRKTARTVTAEGVITEIDAEHFNARYIGNEGIAEVEFYGPKGTYYYAIMIYDETYSTLYLP